MSRPVNSVTVSRSKRGTTVKASGKAAQALFDAMTQSGRSDLEFEGLEGLRTVTKVIHFVDHGQDYVRWVVNAAGLVLDSWPAMRDYWVGCILIGTPEVGKPVHVERQGKHVSSINRVSKIDLHLQPAEGPEPSPEPPP